MGLWIFMLAMSLLIPTIMFGYGWYFTKKAPKEINPIFGYRTTMSMKNQDTWEFAHKYCGRIWRVCGAVLLPVTVVSMLLTLGKSEDCIGTVGSSVCLLQLAPLIGSIVPIEVALRKTFHKDGTRK